MSKKTREWLKNAVFYEIYPQSFYDTNGDGIGDLNGIIEKLDYIKDLGCNAFWINPCFVSPFMDAGYDISDYYNIAPRYGTNDDMKRLCKEAHNRGMHVLLDLVAGHTSIEHPWFKQSSKAEKNEYTHRYVWTDTIWNPPPELATLRGFSERDGAAVVNFFSFQPALNYGYQNIDKKWQFSTESEEAKATLNAMKDVMAFWLDIGCDGFRVDLAASLVKNDPDDVGITKLWNNVREFLDSKYPDAALVSEWGNPAAALKAGFDMDFLLHFGPSHYMDLFRKDKPYFSKNATVDIAEFIETYRKNYEPTYNNGYICIPSGNHDMVRISDKLDDKALRLAFAFLLTMPGCPFIYYGDEIGMKYERLKSKEGGYYRTGSRRPMQWNTGKNFGFSNADAANLYLPVDTSDEKITVEVQKNDENSLYNQVKTLLKIRNSNKELQSDARLEFLTETGCPLVYTRQNEGGKMLIMINPANKDAFFGTKLIGKNIYTLGAVQKTDGGYSLSPQSAAFIKVNQ